MKIYLIPLFLTFNYLIFGQDYFVSYKGNSPNINEIGLRLSINNSNEIFLIKNKLINEKRFYQELSKIDTNGLIKKSTNIINGFMNTQDLLFDNNYLLFTGSKESNVDTIFFKRYNNDLMLIDSNIILGNESYIYSIYLHSALEFNNKYLIAGTARNKNPLDTVDYTGYIFSLNKDLSLDTIIKLETGYIATRLFSISKNTQELMTLFCPVLKKNHDEFYCFYQYNKDFLQKKDTCIKYSFQPPYGVLTGIILSNGNLVSTMQGRRTSKDNTLQDFRHSLIAFDESINHLWRNHNGVSGSYMEYTNLIESDNSSVIGAGAYYGSHDSYLTDFGIYQPYMSKADHNGKTLWQRIFVNKQGITLPYSEYFNDLIELPNKDIMAVGVGIEEIAVGGEKKLYERTLIGKVDKYGCLEKDRCSEVINVGSFIDSLYNYDQITTRGKEWYYTITDENGNRSTYKNEFYVDQRKESLYNGQPDNFSEFKLYRELLFQNEIDTTISGYGVNWNINGTASIRHFRNVIITVGTPYSYDSLLYDFRLRVGDKFRLPAEYGTATVIKVDSIVLYDGYTRKRIILNHDNLLNQEKFGPLTWIEGIGSPNGLLYFLDWRNNTKTEINCYFDRDKKRYGQAPDCNGIFTSTKEVNHNFNDEITIFPNPHGEEFYILRNEKSIPIDKIEIFDIHGNKQFTASNLSEDRIAINTKNWNDGLYLVHCISKNGMNKILKIIKMQ